MACIAKDFGSYSSPTGGKRKELIAGEGGPALAFLALLRFVS
jgi:hypothetical protein